MREIQQFFRNLVGMRQMPRAQENSQLYLANVSVEASRSDLHKQEINHLSSGRVWNNCMPGVSRNTELQAELKKIEAGDSADIKTILNRRTCADIIHFIKNSNYLTFEKKFSDGYTLLHLVIRNNFPGVRKIVRELLNYDVDCNVVADNGDTPLHEVARNGNQLVLKILADIDNLDFNQLNKNGQAPLHLALENGDDSMARHLLGKGADPHQKDHNGRSSAVLMLERIVSQYPAIKQDTVQCALNIIKATREKPPNFAAFDQLTDNFLKELEEKGRKLKNTQYPSVFLCQIFLALSDKIEAGNFGEHDIFIRNLALKLTAHPGDTEKEVADSLEFIRIYSNSIKRGSVLKSARRKNKDDLLQMFALMKKDRVKLTDEKREDILNRLKDENIDIRYDEWNDLAYQIFDYMSSIFNQNFEAVRDIITYVLKQTSEQQALALNARAQYRKLITDLVINLENKHKWLPAESLKDLELITACKKFDPELMNDAYARLERLFVIERDIQFRVHGKNA
ncbi:ankyrin repeat domain-containing protein [Paraburkholderia bonniea]|uniref:ankyrin repeat domain-containing protein n=1 Tax=Paraburkholderia bonniea TaxID=2152891 RepID=UPI00129241F1|nr:ankyrin repeat domain-containing protein [Paraburkholderia bonniea]